MSELAAYRHRKENGSLTSRTDQKGARFRRSECNTGRMLLVFYSSIQTSERIVPKSPQIVSLAIY